jgi:hypothetical protein
MVRFNTNELMEFLEKHGFHDTLDDIAMFINLHPCSDNVVYFEVDMFNGNKPKVYAIVKIDVEKWVEELISDNPA